MQLNGEGIVTASGMSGAGEEIVTASGMSGVGEEIVTASGMSGVGEGGILPPEGPDDPAEVPTPWRSLPPLVSESMRQASAVLEGCRGGKSFLVLYGYPGSGKMDTLHRYAERHAGDSFLLDSFSTDSPSVLIQKTGRCLGLALKQRKSELGKILDFLREHPGRTLLYEEVCLDQPNARAKLDILRSIYEETETSLVLCGCPRFYRRLNGSRPFAGFCDDLQGLVVVELQRPSWADARPWLEGAAEEARFCLGEGAEEKLRRILTDAKVGGSHTFRTVLARCVCRAEEEQGSEGRLVIDGGMVGEVMRDYKGELWVINFPG